MGKHLPPPHSSFFLTRSPVLRLTIDIAKSDLSDSSLGDSLLQLLFPNCRPVRSCAILLQLSGRSSHETPHRDPLIPTTPGDSNTNVPPPPYLDLALSSPSPPPRLPSFDLFFKRAPTSNRALLFTHAPCNQNRSS